jgi:tetratricopeptide (TPR) repeat protein
MVRAAVESQTGVRLHEPVPFDHAEFASLLGLGDLAIELEGPAAVIALEAGVPILTLEDSPTTALLRTAGLERLIFSDVAARDAELRRLLRDADARGELRDEVARAMKVMPRFADNYAIAADFTALLECAWDELCASGARGFRRSREPIQVENVHSIDPLDLQAEGRALFAAGRFERAASCFLSAIQRNENDASLWFDLARSYQAIGDQASAIATLEASLRLDEANAPGWLMLGEMAADAGMADLAQDALGVAEGLDGDSARIANLRVRIAA